MDFNIQFPGCLPIKCRCKDGIPGQTLDIEVNEDKTIEYLNKWIELIQGEEQ